MGTIEAATIAAARLEAATIGAARVRVYSVTYLEARDFFVTISSTSSTADDHGTRLRSYK